MEKAQLQESGERGEVHIKMETGLWKAVSAVHGGQPDIVAHEGLPNLAKIRTEVPRSSVRLI